MTLPIDILLADSPEKWVQELPEYQRDPLLELLRSGLSFDEIAQRLVTATTANTFQLGAGTPIGDKNNFLANVKKEIRAFLCGDPRYKTERDGLFGEASTTRTFFISAVAVAISPPLGVAAALLAPIIALVLASIGKITLNAWCDLTA